MGETVHLRDDVRMFGTMNPTDIRDYAGTQTLNKAFADRWVIWEKSFPGEDQVKAMLELRYPGLSEVYVDAISRLTVEINASFDAADSGTRVGDAAVPPVGARPSPHRSDDLRRTRRPAACGMGGVRPPPSRPLRPRPLRDGVERRGAPGTIGGAVLAVSVATSCPMT